MGASPLGSILQLVLVASGAEDLFLHGGVRRCRFLVSVAVLAAWVSISFWFCLRQRSAWLRGDRRCPQRSSCPSRLTRYPQSRQISCPPSRHGLCVGSGASFGWRWPAHAGEPGHSRRAVFLGGRPTAAGIPRGSSCHWRWGDYRRNGRYGMKQYGLTGLQMADCGWKTNTWASVRPSGRPSEQANARVTGQEDTAAGHDSGQGKLRGKTEDKTGDKTRDRGKICGGDSGAAWRDRRVATCCVKRERTVGDGSPQGYLSAGGSSQGYLSAGCYPAPTYSHAP